MVLNISSSMSLVIFVGLIIPLILSYQSYFYGRDHYVFLNQSNVESIKGVCLVIILMNQMIERVSQPDSLLQLLKILGIGALSIYLFLTGIEIQKISKNKNSPIRKTLIRRSLRLFLMFLFGNLFIAIALIYLGEDISILEPIWCTIRGQFVDGKEDYLFMPLIIFHLLFGITKNIKIISLLGLVVGWPGVLISLGIWTMTYRKMIFLILRKHLVKMSMISGILLLLSIKYYALIPVASIIAIMVIFMKVQFKSKVFRLINRFSMPLYILQIPMLYLVFYSSEPKNSTLVLISMGISFIVVMLLQLFFISDLKQLKLFDIF